MRRTSIVVSLVLVLIGGLSACAGRPTSSGNARDVRIATINLLTFSPVYVADRLGYFKDEGLNVTLVPTDSGNASVQAMLGRSVDAAAAGFDTPIQLTTKGQQVQSLVGLEMATIYAFVGGPKFPQIPSDDPQAFVRAMRGRKFGVASAGSTGDTIARGLFSEYGLNPDTDVTITSVGTGAAASAALRSGAVDALVSYEPDLTKITSAGVGRVVFDLRTSTNEKTYSQLPTSTLEATTQWIKANPTVAKALVRAVARADDTLRTNPSVALPVLDGLYPELSAAEVHTIYDASQTHFRPAIPKQTFDAAMRVYREAKLVSTDVPYDTVIATQYTQDWTS